MTQDSSSWKARLSAPPLFSRLEPYTPVVPFEVWAERLGRKPEAIIKLDANENPYGPSPKAAQVLGRAQWVNIYPDPDSSALRQALSDHVDLPADRLFAGAGADELIDLILRATLVADDVVIDCPPTFGMYSFSTQVTGGRVLNVPRQADFSLDVDAIEKAVAQEPRAKVIFACSPNNPDGSVIDDQALQRLLRLPVLVVLDEAYVEFYGRSRMEWVTKHENLVVLRTFSKWAGLAGLRVGYGAFPSWLLSRMWPIKQPYNVNVPASQAAIASLQDVAGLMANVEKLRAERQRLLDLLGALDKVTVYPSQSNFILCRLHEHNPKELRTALTQHGVLIRYYDKPGLRDCIRISVGRPADTDLLMAALKQVGMKARVK